MTNRLIFLAFMASVSGASAASSNPPIIEAEPISQEEYNWYETDAHPAVTALRAKLSVDSALDGEWAVANGLSSWSVRVRVPGAKRFQVLLDRDSQVPDDAVFMFERVADGQVLFSLDADELRAGDLLPEVGGEDLRLRIVFAENAQARFLFPWVFRDFVSGDSLKAGAGACNRNVACPEGVARQEQVDATVKYTYFQYPDRNLGLISCTAVLVNNGREDGAGYLITASHCGLTTQEQLDDLSFQAGFQHRDCDAPDEGVRRSEILGRGGAVVARNDESDLLLLRLGPADAPATVKPEYRLSDGRVVRMYWAGWTLDDVPPASSSCAHHPSNSWKKISVADGAAVEGEKLLGRNTSPSRGWVVLWGSGTTEQGSSGAGLFDDATGLLRGQLWGGGASCDNPSGTDLFSQFHRQWDEDPEPSRQLKAWLDPDGVGLTSLRGAYRSATPTPAPSPTPTPSPTPSPTATPAATPTPTAAATAVASLAPSPATARGDSNGGSGSADLAALLIAASLLGRRRRDYRTLMIKFAQDS